MTSGRSYIHQAPLPMSWLHPCHLRRAGFRLESLASASGPLAVPAAAYAIGTTAVVLMADSYGGKSTLAAHAPLLGHKLINDDLVWLNRDGSVSGDGGPACVRAGGWEIFQRSLASWEGPFSRIRLYPFNGGRLVHYENTLRVQKSMPVGAIVFLERESRSPSPEVQPINRAQALARTSSIFKSRGVADGNGPWIERMATTIQQARFLVTLRYCDPIAALQTLSHRASAL